jgi:hypothetical protein
LRRVLTIGGISLAVVLMIGAAAFAGSLGKQVAHDKSRSWKHPQVHAVSNVDHPQAMAVKVRANPSRPVDGDWTLACYKHHGQRIHGKSRKFVQKHPPVIVRLQPTLRHPQNCILTADATYDTRQHGRLVLNLYAKK